ncbi:MAG: SET domain-containing protein-lysine N-methyltransferase [Cytophagales bacterium CG18_big_fil_WC_8_21_14_2_50_42_9]|nr:MAG: SET domain-containing protein-lysine N-methyltransferase [Cytophagales bacterium CG18_big_fil_WC_8_21_14_2_50_42_9]
MLLVQTKLGLSPISGIGLYADKFIPKGTVIWKFAPNLDLKLTDTEYQTLNQQHNFEVLDKYIYKSLISGCYILCADDARFINHSSAANTLDTLQDIEGLTIAAVDIQPGEEITSNYEAFDADFSQYQHLLH